MFVKDTDQFDIESVRTWGGCITQPKYVDDDIVSVCQEYEIPWNGVCLVDVTRVFKDYGVVIADVDTCEIYGGTWMYPANDQSTCESEKVKKRRRSRIYTK